MPKHRLSRRARAGRFWHETLVPIGWLLTASIIIGLAAAAHVHADPQHRYADPAGQWIAESGLAACVRWAADPSLDEFYTLAIEAMGAANLTPYDAGATVGDAFDAWCPSEATALRRMVRAAQRQPQAIA